MADIKRKRLMQIVTFCVCVCVCVPVCACLFVCAGTRESHVRAYVYSARGIDPLAINILFSCSLSS